MGTGFAKVTTGRAICGIARQSIETRRPYIFRAKLPDGYSVPPHWHPMDESATLISGIFRVRLGKKFDKDALRDLPAGS